MRRLSPVLFGVAMVLGVAAIAAPAAAKKLCPPLAVVKADKCECTVHNYATVADPGVTMTVYTDSGTGGATCGPTSVPPKEATSCSSSPLSAQESCGGEVTGEGAKSRVSLSVMALEPQSGNRAGLRASVECRP